MARIFSVDSPHTQQLDAVVSGLEQLEKQAREIEARRAEFLARAVGVAAAECEHVAADEAAARRGAKQEYCEHSSTGATFGLPGGTQAELAMRSVRAEIAAALRVSESAIERHIERAIKLTDHFPNMLACLKSGAIESAHVQVMIDAAAVIGVSDDADTNQRRALYEQTVLKVAVAESPNRLRPLARKIAEHFSERTIDQRHAEARRRRGVWVRDCGDGMANLVVHTSSAKAVAIYNRLMTASKRIAETEAASIADLRGNRSQHAQPLKGQPQGASAVTAEGVTPQGATAEFARRTRDEIRADLATDMLTQGEIAESDAPGIRAHVQVIVPVNVMPEEVAEKLGATKPGASKFRAAKPGATKAGDACHTGAALGPDAGSGPGSGPGADAGAGSGSAQVAAPAHQASATLAGHGPIDTGTAHGLAGNATGWDVVRVNAHTGDVLSTDRYTPTAELRRVLKARDQHCRFLGCRAPLSRCDIDHTVDAQYGGPTAVTNLSHLCRGHHTLKHHGGWGVTQDGEGVLSWRSPTGREYRQVPPSRVMFLPVEPPDAATAERPKVPKHSRQPEHSRQAAPARQPF